MQIHFSFSSFFFADYLLGKNFSSPARSLNFTRLFIASPEGRGRITRLFSLPVPCHVWLEGMSGEGGPGCTGVYGWSLLLLSLWPLGSGIEHFLRLCPWLHLPAVRRWYKVNGLSSFSKCQNLVCGETFVDPTALSLQLAEITPELWSLGTDGMFEDFASQK